MYFGSDNQTGASTQVMQTLISANDGITATYGDDEWSQQAVQHIQQMFGCDAEVFLVSTGTAANSLALACMTQPWDSIVCHGQAHIINDELTAPEFFTGGARLIGLDTQQAKLSIDSVGEFFSQGSAHPPHNAEPKALSLTQLNESGQLYSIAEVTELANIAHQHGAYVHMDGARFANAVVALGCEPADITWKAGVDVLCLGATKNGALSAEAVVFFNKDLAKNFIQHRKRSGHLISKSRWLGAQFCGWLKDDHWFELASHANQMATQLAAGLQQSPLAQLVWPTNGNELFVIFSRDTIHKLRQQGANFIIWPRNFVPENISIAADQDIVRMVTSFRTEAVEVEKFLAVLDSL